MEWGETDGNTLRWCGMEKDGAALTGMDTESRSDGV